MSRDIPAALVSIIEQDTNEPVELYELYLPTITYYYANAEQNITLGAQTYTALPLMRTRIATSSDSKVDEITVQLDNVDLTFSQLLRTTQLQGMRIVIKKVFRGYLGDSANIITVFDGVTDSIDVNQERVAIRIVSLLDAVTKNYPGRMYQISCNYKFGDTWCTVDRESAANKATGTAEAGSTTTLLVCSGLIQADDYWQYGFVKVTAGTNNGFSRPISSFTTGNVVLRLPFPNALNITSQFTIYRGCDKRKDTCINTFNNWVNYGGFTTIPETPII